MTAVETDIPETHLEHILGWAAGSDYNLAPAATLSASTIRCDKDIRIRRPKYVRTKTISLL